MPEKPKGWHSRRHETNAENNEAVNAYQWEHGEWARKRKAAERLGIKDAENMTSAELHDALSEKNKEAK